MERVKVEIIVGFQCNQNCKFCSIKYKNYYKPFEQIIREIDEAAKENPYEINFTGGEPTLRKDLPELIKYASEKVEMVRITTNGEMLSYEKYTKKLVDSGLGGAIFSIHSSKERIHDFLTSVKGGWRLSIKGIRNLSKYVSNIGINSVITTLNYKDLPELEKFLVKNFKIVTHCIIYPLIEGNLLKNMYLLPKYEEVKPYVLEALDIAISNGIVAWAFNIPPCFLPAHEKDSSIMKYSTKMYWENEVTDLDEKKKEKNIMLEECNRCELKDLCPGIQVRYIRKFGKPPVKPIREEIKY